VYLNTLNWTARFENGHHLEEKFFIAYALTALERRRVRLGKGKNL